MFFAYTPTLVTWKVIKTDVKTGKTWESEGPNLVVNAGRDLLFTDLFAMTGSAGLTVAAVGACSTAAAVTDTRLAYELNMAGRKALTNVAGAALSPADITADTVVISGTTYYKKMVVKASWAAGIGTGHYFGEYMLNTSATSAVTPTSTSGTMFNHYIDPSPSLKGADTAVEVQITARA